MFRVYRAASTATSLVEGLPLNHHPESRFDAPDGFSESCFFLLLTAHGTCWCSNVHSIADHCRLLWLRQRVAKRSGEAVPIRMLLSSKESSTSTANHHRRQPYCRRKWCLCCGRVRRQKQPRASTLQAARATGRRTGKRKTSPKRTSASACRNRSPQKR